jgi:hypothetical protein
MTSIVARTEWPTPSELETNEARLASQLRNDIKRYEARFGLDSCHLQDALASGEIMETADVCRWLVALETLQALESGAPE